jgi:uncharacterized protein
MTIYRSDGNLSPRGVWGVILSPVNSWDEAKRATNLDKHGVDFASLDGFVWDGTVTFADDRREYAEPRTIAIGRIGNRVHVLVFTWRDGSRRIISARKANPREVRFYAREAVRPDP